MDLTRRDRDTLTDKYIRESHLRAPLDVPTKNSRIEMQLTRRQINHIETKMWELMEELGLDENETLNWDLVKATMAVIDGSTKGATVTPVRAIPRLLVDPADVDQVDERKGNAGHLRNCPLVHSQTGTVMTPAVCTCDATGWASRRAVAQQEVRGL